ncbi:MAG: PD-(D/E)XK nuclease family protein [Solirubrobacterales bacterium]
MPLILIHGPLNSGRAGLVRRGFIDALDRDPVLVVPTADDVYAFERELCEEGTAVGGTVMTFPQLFATVASAGGIPPADELTTAQRLRAISVAIGERRGSLGPLRRSASRQGFAAAFDLLLNELQGNGLEPETLKARAGSAEVSAYLTDLAGLFAGYAEVRDRIGRVDRHGTAASATSQLRRSDDFWRARPVFLYGFDDLTPSQLELVELLARRSAVTVAVPYEAERRSLAARADLLEQLRTRVADVEEIRTQADPRNTDDPLLFHLERGFGEPDAVPQPPSDSLVLLRSAGRRAEAEAIALQVARLVHEGTDPAEIAVVLRDPVRHGEQIATMLESYGVGAALEAELPVATTGVGGALIALLEAAFGSARATDLLRFLRGPSGVSPKSVDWLERAVRRRRLQTADDVLEHWAEKNERQVFDMGRIRAAAADSPAALSRTVAELAATMASRPFRQCGDGPPLSPGDGLELRAAAAIAKALTELAEPAELAPPAGELAGVLATIRFRAWSGPVEGRVRIADPYRLRAARFDHVFVASLQDGDFPRRDRGDSFLSEQQRRLLGLEPRRATDVEERYLFHVCLSLPRKRLFLSYRENDEDGAAEVRSPLLDDIRRLLDPPPSGEPPDAVEEAIVRSRDLARVVHPLTEAPSENELARAIAGGGPGTDPEGLLATADVADDIRDRVLARLERARAAEAASRAPGPLSNPATIESLASVGAYGGTTLEEFDRCSYRWFVGHELRPEPLDPRPEPLVQGGLIHDVLNRLYRERPGTLPSPESLPAWIARAEEMVREVAVESKLGDHPAERAMVRQVDRLLARFLKEEAQRASEGFEPWLLEATFGEADASDRPMLSMAGWGLHGAIDRVDRAPDGRTLVIDYKLSGSVTALDKFEENAKLQLPLYLLAVAEHWGGQPVGALYHPLRATSLRRPRGVVLEEAAADLASYRLYGTDLVDEAGLETVLAEARGRAEAIVARMRAGDIRRDPGPRPGLRWHGVCPPFCTFAPICRRDRAPVIVDAESRADEP